MYVIKWTRDEGDLYFEQYLGFNTFRYCSKMEAAFRFKTRKQAMDYIHKAMLAPENRTVVKIKGGK